MPRLTYPPAATLDQVDDYHGTQVPDPYRWLEDTESQAGDAPTLIRIQTKAGHGLGKPTHIMIEEETDLYAFLVEVLDME
jgi:prolyl oligopeptidase